jgi:predicted deacetylase
MKKSIKIILLTIFSLIILLFLTRLILPREIDDVSPKIPCEKELLEKADVLWVIPNLENRAISKNAEWCQEILSLNKTIGLHGVSHTYHEFGTNKTQEYLQEGINIFTECFNQTPTSFKPPQLKISEENKILIKKNNLALKTIFNQITHKVYHCNDTGKFSNRFIDLF